MPRIEPVIEQEDGWSDWITPTMAHYRMACCDCGLVHDMQFLAVRVTKTLPDGSWAYKELDPKKYRVVFKASRNNRSSGQMRRKIKDEETKDRFQWYGVLVDD